jgi:DUF4097 and DUF4098 domain-containing protein YvlB
MRLLPFALLVPVLGLLTSCDIEDVAAMGNSNRYQENFHFSYPVKPGSTVSLESFNGSIEVASWEKDEVEVNGTKYAATEELLHQIKLEGVTEGGGVRFRAMRPEGRWGNGGARMIVRVPRRISLQDVRSSNGGIRIDAIEGAVRARSSNGPIRLRSVKGAMAVETSNGGIEATTVEGDFDARTSNGAVRVDGLRGSFSATTSNGSITAKVDALPEGKLVRAKSSNGSIELALPGYRNQEIDAQSSNSSVTVRLPATVNAELRASTSNASIQTDFNVVTSGAISKHRLEGKLGNGGATIRLASSNGSIRVQKL